VVKEWAVSGVQWAVGCVQWAVSGGCGSGGGGGW
tara:strand:+ start:158826 stop:158927 length:102 start_codon:yes stop_codon:yes gene_type:complete